MTAVKFAIEQQQVNNTIVISVVYLPKSAVFLYGSIMQVICIY